MKKRTSFVSNSSSSSFIFYDWGAFEYFNITKKDLVDAFTNLLGKDYVKKFRSDRKRSMREHPEWFDKDQKQYDNIGPFYIYDMLDPKDKKEAYERWGDLLSDWDCRYTTIEKGKLKHQENFNTYETLMEKLGNLYGIIGDITKQKKPTMFIHTNKKQKNGCYGYDVPVPKDIVKMFKNIRKKCNIKTNFEILKHKMSRFFLHFNDNELWEGCGSMPEKTSKKYDENDKEYGKYNKIHNDLVDKSIYKTEPYTRERVMEMLFLYFVNIGKIKVNDKKFLDSMYKVDEDDWRLKDEKYKNMKYNTINTINLSYLDLDNELLAYVGHEG